MTTELHFLERGVERMDRADLEAAMRLYCRPKLVDFILKNATLPPGDGRIALCLDPGGQGPYVVVTREGRFVTCLARGMTTGGAHVLRRSQIDALTVRHEAERVLHDHVRALTSQEVPFFRRLMDGPLSLDRDEFRACMAFAPYAVKEYVNLLGETTKFVENNRTSLLYMIKSPPRQGDTEHARKLWEAIAARGRLTMLIAIGLADDPPEEAATLIPLATRAAGDGGDLLSAMRSAWAAARMGKVVLPAYKRAFREAKSVEQWNDALFALLAIGVRHRNLRAEVRKVLYALPPTWATWTRLRYSKYLPYLERAFVDSSAADAVIRTAASNVMQGLASLAGVEPPGLDLYQDAELALAIRLPLDLRLDIDVSLVLIPILLSRVAVAPAEALFLPAALARVLRPRWRPDHLLTVLLYNKEYHDLCHRPASKSVTQGRNERCACGSGKKYKVCCAA